MRIVFAALPAAGHWYPLMPLARACRDAGHDVVFATGAAAVAQLAGEWEVAEVAGSTDAAAQEVVRSGLDFRSLPPQERWRVGATLFAGPLAATVTREIAPVLARQRPDLVVYEEMDMGAALGARLAGVPAVRHGLGPWLPPPMLQTCRDLLVGHLKAAGIPDPQDGDLFGEVHLDVWPAELPQPGRSLPIPSTPLRPVVWDDPAIPVPAPLASVGRRPLVYLTLGTVNHGHDEVLRAALAGLADLDVDVLAAIGSHCDPAELGQLRPGITTTAFAPGALALRRADLVVHHGGSGTTLGALAAGRPQLVLPQVAHDQFINAAAVAASGAGSLLLPPQQNAEAVARSAASLLEPAAHRQPRRLAEQLAVMPAPADLLPTLASTVGTADRAQQIS